MDIIIQNLLTEINELKERLRFAKNKEKILEIRRRIKKSYSVLGRFQDICIHDFIVYPYKKGDMVLCSQCRKCALQKLKRIKR